MLKNVVIAVDCLKYYLQNNRQRDLRTLKAAYL